ncbi:hypothetical protein DOM21_16670 [Bacteriovorax stolpii]|uniref:hypothetical protein n=1 Tax=Bacteriovorax stolpii TaxID=960 RepID=UPI0011587643|nr:hypothetical protein [Bacteriovorax stolpii]QDK43058.1 hypothetical protein DOM21_16670 [Bacteriovorax stolpii]
MKTFKHSLFFFCILAVPAVVSFHYFNHGYSPSRAIAQVHSPDGEYEVVGVSDIKGEYSGRAWVHGGVVQRIVKWKNYSYQGMAVESVWSGKVTPSGFDFSLSLSNVLTRFEDYDATKEELIPVKVTLPLEGLTSEFSATLKGDGVIKETWTRLKDAGQNPLWVDQRTSFVGNGDKHPFITMLSKIAGMYKVIEAYRELPQIKIYEDKEVFKKGQQIWVEDKTDADFYLKNPNVLRITNKTVNPLSLAEAVMRKNAYGHTLTYKENFLTNETQKLNLNDAGMLEVARIDSAGNKIGMGPEGDSALWTGIYGWSQVIRYQMTKDPEAMANFKKVLNGTLTLLEIPNDPKQFARTLAISAASEVWSDEWIQGTGQYSHLKWMKRGNNDMAKGIFLTLALAHKMVDPSEVQLIERIKKAVKSFPSATAIEERSFNFGIAKGLDALWNKDEESLLTFQKKMLNFESFISNFTHLDAGLYIEGIADWSGIHLTMSSIMSQYFVSEELIKVFPNEYFNKKIHAKAEASLIELDEVYKNGHRRFVTLVAYTYSPKARKDKKFEARAREALWTLKEVPAPRFVGNAGADLPKRPDWSISAWPRQPWKGLTGFRKMKEDFNVAELQQGAYFYPYFEGSTWNTTYYWKDIPFPVHINSDKSTKSFSSDYLMLYWVSRSSGLITAED